MNNLNDTKPSQKVFLLVLLGILLVGIPLTVIALQQQQIFKQFAWSATQTATPKCDASAGTVNLSVSFSNTDSKSMNVVAKDLQTGNSIDLGTIKSNKSKTDIIVTQEKSLKAGSVEFTLTWTDGNAEKATKTANYKAIQECAPPPPFCPATPDNNQGICTWDPLEGAEGYTVEITNVDSGTVIKSESVPKDASQSAFPMIPGTAYQCNVTPINACSDKGEATKSPEKTCSVLTPTPTETPFCPAEPNKPGVCIWDPVDGADSYNVTVKDSDSGDTIKSDTVNAPTTKFEFQANPNKTYQCIVTAVNQCSQTPPSESPPTSCTLPSPTPLPSPTITPLPTITPRPSPTVTITPTPTLTPTPTPSDTPTPTPSPKPTETPKPTPTPIVIVRIPPNNLPPQQQVIVVQPTVPGTQQQQQQQQQQPGVTVIQEQTTNPRITPSPTMKPTGAVSNIFIMSGASIVLLLVGGIFFFLI